MSFYTAIVLLRDQVALSAEDLLANFAALWPHRPEPVVLETSLETQPVTISFAVGHREAVLADMRFPMPWSDLGQVCQWSPMWKHPEDVLRNHATHFIVTVKTGDGPVEQSRFLTEVCASVLASYPEALGVLWINASMLIPRELFLSGSREALPDELPLHLWVNCHVGVNEQGKHCGSTIGLAQLGHMDIEATDSPESLPDLFDQLAGLTQYLLDNGPIIKDGDTMGESALARIRIVYGKSLFDPERGQVMHLEYIQHPKSKGWVDRIRRM
jgi:hypothetical protein